MTASGTDRSAPTPPRHPRQPTRESDGGAPKRGDIPFLSIVIPARNESQKIAADIRAAVTFLQAHGLSGEIIVVDDGSTDGTAREAESAPIPPGSRIRRRVILLEQHQGKGAAVRAGILESRGRYVLVSDSGLCIPFEAALTGIDMIANGQCDIAHGSRHLPESRIVRPHKLHRRVFSWLFRRLVLPVMGIRGLTDTQCGFKVYRGDVARNLYRKCRSRGFEFDIETILLARRAGLRIREFPVEWRSDRDSRFPSLTGPIRCTLALARLRLSLAKSAKGSERTDEGTPGDPPDAPLRS